MTGVPFLARQERFASVGSTNDVVRAWLEDGTPEVCLAVADEQTAGRGRDGRTWTAPPGAGLLLSVGFRPGWLEPDRVWRLAAIVALAMADAAETVVGLPTRSIRLKWPNDLVIESWPDPGPGGDSGAWPGRAPDPVPGPDPGSGPEGVPGPRPRVLPAGQLTGHEGGSTATRDPSQRGFAAHPATNQAYQGDGGPSEGLQLNSRQRAIGSETEGVAAPTAGRLGTRPVFVRRADVNPVLKLAGVLGESAGLGTADPRAIVGIGVNADWPAEAFPADLAPTMTSLCEVGGGRAIDAAALLEAFVDRLEVRTLALQAGRFDAAGWVARQLTNGRPVQLDAPGGRSTVVRALGVDVESGGLVVADPSAPDGQRSVLTGEIVHLRLTDDPVDARPVGV